MRKGNRRVEVRARVTRSRKTLLRKIEAFPGGSDLLPAGVFPTERIRAEDDYLGWEKSSPWLLP